MAISSTVKMHGMRELSEALLKLPKLYRQRIVFYALNKCAGVVKAQVIQNLVTMGLVKTGNLKRSIKVAAGKVRNRDFEACVLVGIRRMSKGKRIFGKAARKSKAATIEQLKKLGAVTAFYGGILERDWLHRTKTGTKLIKGEHFMSRALQMTKEIIVTVFCQYIRDKLPEVMQAARSKYQYKRRYA